MVKGSYPFLPVKIGRIFRNANFLISLLYLKDKSIFFFNNVIFIILGKINVSVDGPSKTEVTCHDNNDGTMSITYVPPSPGEYKIAIKAGDRHIRGSPFSAKITGKREMIKCPF